MSAMHLNLNLALSWLSQARGERLDGVEAQRVHTDSRSLQAGDLFVALRGERFDGNQFIAQAKAQGAVAVVCEASGQAIAAEVGMPALLVPDARLALGELAAGWRAQFDVPVIAVTGSNGKTTVTQMIASILRAHAGDDALSTQGNFNNDIGVPLTLFNLRAHHRIAVVELGMNHPGEIAYLARLAQPTVALVNNAQREHQEFMGTVKAVAEENGAVLQALPANGVAIFPADDAYTSVWQALSGQRARRTFALQQADVSAAVVLWQAGAWQFTLKSAEGTAPVRVHIAGRHNVKNALAASACALAAGVPLEAVAQGLQAFEPVKGRSRACVVPGSDITLVDDTYNANPDSVLAAIDVLAELPGPRLLVLGDMGEVGNQGPEFHAEVGAYAAGRGIEAFYTLGDLCVHAAKAFGEARHFADMADLLDAVTRNVLGFQSIVVKGSRFMKMEQVVQALMTPRSEQNQQQGEAHAA
ncbi:UDP-N-acetylmuramoylalanyl-D-glutamyl-2, 6-diaminopimelate--D-alanyl-D-alanine ligase [Limnohabitans sp. T6-5]|uniref:UDP-N-acetylmuramoyl-tripeptide--D-alanyl-D- alanine ligase n=1 Tax=Limnohabitans sp. T6-5 TaxID=1100724 RepID=UPI000D3D10C6|nr:UDP-N-acetylmuramoyl-tripeptide--D-alanyl-D-alanine ligase [Limnohabitans sp. T6-5]PUE11594.1 UDP-N-acetylmuramoylalanyl-D-glutamyl-2, 6-diaminopimelate--D-alanyl-D-alanine ligase [Limnohabitans sp. T6-5]